jgi:hypothetical protein
MALDKFKAPNFPAPPKQYEFPYFNQMIRALNTFLTVSDDATPVRFSKSTVTQLKLPYAEVTLVDGNNDDIQPSANSFLLITGPTAAFDVRGINSNPQNENDGRVIILVNRTVSAVGGAPQNMTIHNEEAAVTAENRIVTTTGGNLNNTHSVILMYSVKISRWLVVSHQ